MTDSPSPCGMERINCSAAILAAGLFLLPAPAAAQWAAGWKFRKPVAVAPGAVASRLVGFPLLVQRTDPDLRHVLYGGQVQHPTGADIAFTGADGVTPLTHEVERYDATTGELVAWVKLPELGSEGSNFYMYFDNPDISVSRADPASLWSAASGYVGVWHLGEDKWNGNPDEVRDSTGTNPGVAAGGCTPVTGKIGHGATFGAVNSNVDAGFNPSLRPTSMTISTWANPASIGSAPNRHPYMVRQDHWRTQGNNPRGYYMEVYRTQTDPRVTFYTGNGDTYAHAFSTTEVVNGRWYYVAGTRDEATGLTQLFIDGNLEDTKYMDGGVAYLTQPLFIGGFDFETWNGQLDEVRVSSVARSKEWIKAEYDNQSAPESFSRVGAIEKFVSPDAGTAVELLRRDFVVRMGCTAPGFIDSAWWLVILTLVWGRRKPRGC